MIKKLTSIFLSIITVVTAVLCIPLTNAFAASPVLSYTFEDGTDLPELFGGAAVKKDSIKGNVLSLSGENGCYAQLPTDKFSDTMTISMDVKAAESNKNYFTFAYGTEAQGNDEPQQYAFLRVRGTNTRFAVTKNGHDNEREVFANFRKVAEWQNVTIVIDNTKMSMYLDGVLETHYQLNENTEVKTSDLGDNLVAFLGKSFFKDDDYFNGMFDNVKIYDFAMTADEVVESIAQSIPLANTVTVGTLSSDYGIQLDWEYQLRGTDDHTAVTSKVDYANHEITSYIRFGTPLNSVPVTFNSALIDKATITVDGKPFTNGSKLDLNSDKKVEIKYNGRVESYTLRVPVYAYNPVLPGQYADPDIDYFDGKYWIYPTTDGYYWWSGTLCHAFSSTDLINWTDEGVILDVDKNSADKQNYVNEKGVKIAVSPWSVSSAWAPTVEKKNGKYYLYYCGRPAKEFAEKYGADANGEPMMAIGVAVSNSPTGPFVCQEDPVCYQNLYKKEIPTYTGEQIDPAIFTDDDGKSYIVSGGSCVAFIAELSDDMLSVKEGTIMMLHRPADPDGKNGINFMHDFLESFYIFKRKGYYYFTWSCYGTNGEDYTVKAFKIQDSSKKTFYQLIEDKMYKFQNSNKLMMDSTYTILTKDVYNDYLCTGHQSFVYREDIDECLIAYHRFSTPLYNYPTGLGFHRETCIERVTFNSAKEINPIKPTMQGVSKVNTSKFTVKLSANSFKYTGKAITPSVVVKDEKGNTISDTCYTVSYSDNIKAGTAKAVVTFKNNYVGSLTKTFAITSDTVAITPIKITSSNAKVTLSKTSYTYDGKAKKPTVTVKDKNGNTISSANYTVSYSNNKDVGKATVKLTFKGSFTGTLTASFKINPKPTEISKLTAGKKKLTVKWKKQTTQTTGYQLQYSTSSKFKSAKTVTVTKNKTTSKTISKLKASKKYYVRIRTYKKVGSSTFYSAWSKAKTVTTKK